MSQHLFEAIPPGASRARLLLAWSPRQLEPLSQRVAAVWNQWLADWRPEGEAGNVACACADAEPHRAIASWNSLGEREFATAWVHADRQAWETIGACLFNIDGVTASTFGPVGKVVATKAWDALTAALREALQLDQPVDPGPALPALFKPWSGAVTVSLRIGTHEVLALLLDAACAIAIGPARAASPQDATPLTQVRDAIAERTLRLEVALEPCELDLGTLAQLRIGDLIPLPHSLESPLQVTLAGKEFCAGYLGRHGEFKAVQLARGVTNPPIGNP